MTERYERTLRNKPSIVPPLSTRVKKTANDNNFDVNSPILLVHRHFAPWLSRSVECDLTLTKHNKKAEFPQVILQEYLELKCRYGEYAQFFTDVSKTASHVACSMVGPSVSLVLRIDERASVFTAELYALQLTLDSILEEGLTRSVIFSDSLSALDAVCSPHLSKHALVFTLQHKVFTASQGGRRVVFCWVPSHVGIPGNEAGDRLARLDGQIPTDMTSLPYEDYKRELRHLMTPKWQSEWNEQNTINCIESSNLKIMEECPTRRALLRGCPLPFPSWTYAPDTWAPSSWRGRLHLQ